MGIVEFVPCFAGSLEINRPMLGPDILWPRSCSPLSASL